MAKLTSSPISIIIIFYFFQSSNAAYNVVSFGAKPDGRTDSTQPFLRAWSSACKSVTMATIYVPRGSFVIRAVVFGGPCRSKVVFRIDGTLVAPSNYWNVGNSGYWILFSKVVRVSIYGGTIDGRGSGFWACRRTGENCPNGARSISFSWSRKIVVSGLTSINSQTMHMALDHSQNIVIKNVKIIAPTNSPNTDGIHMQSSTGITIILYWVVIKATVCFYGSKCSIGSLGDYAKEDGVENVTVTSAIFTKTQNGVRIKSWARPSNGYARNLVFRNIIMNSVYNPIIIDQNYCPDNRGCPRQSSGVKISGVTYKNIKGSSATQVGINFQCSSNNPCRGIKLQYIKLTYNGRPSISHCNNAHGTTTGLVIPTSCL
ncbi:hypothetical protein EZV62_024630 [Acer yangbiense]|uniref:Pectate lyase superfamily protein domain-containing protein n=1 Tax=Acer yangbiense TaxID=1000413 RepID=A0A5C7GW87_9ROSI|nr:hypothetical protein EZV62_024630 [Acer yangbiense]